MNNQSPLVPQSSFLEQKNKGRTRVMIAVFVALSINGIGLMALLMQGCQKPPETTPATPPEPTNATPAFEEQTNVPAAPTNVVVAPALPTTPVTNPTPVEPVAPPAPPAGGTEYSIVKGDTFGLLAKKFHVSVKAIKEANPGVDPTKLKIGQKLHIPAAAASVPTAAGATSTEAVPTGGEQTYTVKSGDNLSTIAKEKGVSVKALRAANNLKTDRITVGQKLKVPVKASAPAASTATPTEPMPSATGAPPTAPSGR
jgi:peptidoglycan DL-endopeptidase LytF